MQIVKSEYRERLERDGGNYVHTAQKTITIERNRAMLRSPQQQPMTVPSLVYTGRLRPEQVAMLEAEFLKVKTFHETDLSLMAAEMAASERDVQAWYTQRVAAWRREQGLSDCFGQI